MSHDHDSRHPLSKREREILLWACRGKTYAEIALITRLSNASVKTYLDTARHKLNVVNLPQACAVAVVHGILSRDDILNRPEEEEAAPSSARANGRRRPRNRL
jgi:DNA-binding CsgD family transcriptional regulator